MTYPEAFQHAVAVVLEHEGSEYTNDADDSGGPTKYGITLEDLRENDPAATAQDVQNLTEDQAKVIYYKKYWLGPNIDLLPTGPLQLCVFDQGVLLGPKKAIEILQGSLDVAADGIIGPITLGEIGHFKDGHIAIEFLCNTQNHFIDIVVGRPSQIKFLKGWLARTHDLMGFCV